MRNLVPLLVLVLGLLPGSARAGIAIVGTPPDAAPSAEDQREQDLRALEAIGDLPQTSRVLALAAALHPTLIEEIAAIHRETSGSFRGIGISLSETRREALWEIVRHPALVDALAQTRDSRDWPRSLETRLADEPEDLRDLVLALVAETPEVAAELVALRSLSRSRIEEALAGHPLETQATFHALLAQPDVLGLLTEHTELAAALGALYRRDPEAVETLLASAAQLRGGRAPALDLAAEAEAVAAIAPEEVARVDPPGEPAVAPLVPVSFVLETASADWRPRPVPVFGLGRARVVSPRATGRAPTFRSFSRPVRSRFERAVERTHGERARSDRGSRIGRERRGFDGGASMRSEHRRRRGESFRSAGRFDGSRGGSRRRGTRGGRGRR